MSPLALNLESIPDISLGTAALLVFGAIASLAVLRGLLRILWGTLVLCAAGFLAFLAWRHTPALAHEVLGSEARWPSIVVPAVVFLLAFFLLRAVGRFLVHPLGNADEESAEKNRRSPARWAATLLLSLIPTALLWFSGATLLRHFGSIAEVKAFASSIDDQPVPDRAAFLAKLKDRIEQSIPAEWFESVDPLSDRARVNLAKLLALGDSEPPKAIPVMEEDEVRALVLGDPELRRLAAQGRYSEILRDPRLDRVLENPDLRATLRELEL